MEPTFKVTDRGIEVKGLSLLTDIIRLFAISRGPAHACAMLCFSIDQESFGVPVLVEHTEEGFIIPMNSKIRHLIKLLRDLKVTKGRVLPGYKEGMYKLVPSQ